MGSIASIARRDRRSRASRLLACALLGLLVVHAQGPLAVAADRPDRDGGAYRLPPPDAILIRAVRTNGSLPPEAQAGDEVLIQADGAVTAIVTPEGASPDLAEPTAEQEVLRAYLGEDEVHDLLGTLDDVGYFELPQFGAEDEIAAGGEISFVVVVLAHGVWEARRDNLSATEGETLDSGHAAIRETIGLEGDG